MDSVKEKKKSSSGLIVLVVILLIGLLATSGYIVYDKVIANKETKNNDKEQEKIVDTSEKEEVLDIDNPYIQSLYYKVTANSENFSTNWMFPENKDNIIISEMDEKYKMNLVGINLRRDSELYVSCSDVPEKQETSYSACLPGSNTYSTKKIAKTEIERVYKDLFGKNAELDTSASINLRQINVEKYYYVASIDAYVLYTLAGGGTTATKKIGSLTKAVKINDEIKLYEELAITIEGIQQPSEKYIYTFKQDDENHYYFYSLEKE